MVSGRTVPTLFAVLILLTGCGGESGERPQGISAVDFCQPALARVDSFMGTFPKPEVDPERYGGTAVVGTVGELAVGMNGFQALEAGAIQHQMFVNLMTLIQYDEDLQPVPYLAESWEVSDDLKELTFHLRDDVHWHDGELTTAHDVAFTYRRAVDPATGFPNPGFFQHYLPGEEAVEVVDSFTVRFRFQEAHSDYMDPWRTVAIMPRHLLGGVRPENLARHPFGTVCPVGNGPFRFASHSSGESWTFVANPAFPQELGGRPFLDRYVYRIIPEHTTLLAELLTEHIDVYVATLPHHADRIREEDHLRVISFPYRSVFFAGWNTRVPKLADARVRKALTLATNRRQILEGIRGGRGELANAGVPPVHWAYDSALVDSLPYDPPRARRLLTEAGWVDRDSDGIRESEEGEPLSIELIFNQNQERREVAEIMQAQLGEVGVDLRPRVVEMTSLAERITSPERNFEGVLIAWETEFRLDERDLFHSDAVDGRYAFAGTRDPELDRLLDTLQLIPDREEARRRWTEYQERIIEIQPYTFLYFPHRQDGVNRRLRNVVMDVRGEWANLREWWIAPDHRKGP